MSTKVVTWMVVSCVALLLGATHAHAAIIYSQSPPGDGTRTSDFAASFSNQQAQRFTLAANADIHAIVAWGSYDADPVPADDFTVRFFTDSGGAPGMAPFEQQTAVPVSRQDTGMTTAFGRPIYRYTFTLATPVMLTSGTVYYVSIVNDTSDPQAWGWSVTSGPNNLRWNRGSDASAWASVTTNLAFELSDSAAIPTPVPTPGPTPTPGPPTGVPSTSPSTLPAVALLLALLGVWTLRSRAKQAEARRDRD